jgi:hypothetical protein
MKTPPQVLMLRRRIKSTDGLCGASGETDLRRMPPFVNPIQPRHAIGPNREIRCLSLVTSIFCSIFQKSDARRFMSGYRTIPISVFIRIAMTDARHPILFYDNF